MVQQVLRVDLTSGSYRVESIPDGLLNEYVGGRGLGVRLLYDNCPPGLDPLDPANPLIISAGPVQGSSTLFGPKAVLTTKSPLTKIYLRCVSSGSLGKSLRKAGFFSLLVTGRAPKPTYLVVRDGEVEFRSAEHLWGRMVPESQKAMLKETGLSGGSVLGIGPSGEKGINIACVMSEADRLRAFGRGGAGSVMGSKNLKGLVIHGTSRVGPARPAEYARLNGSIRERIKADDKWAKRWRTYGTGGDIVSLSLSGLLPTRNWQSGSFEGAASIDVSETAVFKESPRRSLACGPNCPNPCSHYATVKSGPYAGTKCRGPEYETIYSFGSNCGVDRMDAIIACAEICDDYGLDTMSTGIAVGFAMECFERGLISLKDTDGLELRFGNHEAMVAMVNKIAERQGLGELLGQGVREASQQISGSESFAMHAKGLELGGYEARASFGQALAYALCPIGGSHGALALPARVEAITGTLGATQGRGKMLKGQAVERVLFDSAILCAFGRGPLDVELLRQLLQATMGREWSDDELNKVGMRVITLERLFNVREGLGRAEDTLPRRLLEEAMSSGPTAGRAVNLEPLKDDGYAALGWDQAGVPTSESLKDLNLV